MSKLSEIGKSYVDLINRIGEKPTLSYEKDVASLFTPDLKKIVNGSLWYEGSDKFVPQLLATREMVGSWNLDLLDVIPAYDGRTVVIRFAVNTEKGNIWNTLVILRCTEDLVISEINEIFNNYEGPR